MFWEWFKHKKELPKATDETIPKEPLTHQEQAKSTTETMDSIPEIVDKSDEILKELKMIYAFLINHDQRLERFSNSTSEYLTTLLMQKNVISVEKVSEAKQILQEAIKNSLSKGETVDKLIEIGVPRSTAYKYSKSLQSKV